MGTAYSHELNAEKLSKRFRVVIFDRRGYARTRQASGSDPELADPSQTVRQNAEDAAAIIRHFARNEDDSALVYGSCFGGTVVLELVQTYPHLVKRAIIHEPLLPSMVSDAESDNVPTKWASVPRLIEESGFRAGSKVMHSMLVGAPEVKILRQTSNHARLTEGSAKHLINTYHFESKSALLYRANWDELVKHKSKLIMAKGELSELPLARLPCERIAQRLSKTAVLTPGGHFPFSSDRDRALARVESLLVGDGGLGSEGIMDQIVRAKL